VSTNSRAIGRLGTAARAVAGVALLALGIVGLPPFDHLIPWWQLALGVAGIPAVLTLGQLARLAFTKAQMQATNALATCLNFAVLGGLLLITPTRSATLVFLGGSMLLAAARGYGGCESLAFSNWLLRRDDQVGCLLFGPLDRLEAERTAVS